MTEVNLFLQLAANSLLNKLPKFKTYFFRFVTPYISFEIP